MDRKILQFSLIAGALTGLLLVSAAAPPPAAAQDTVCQGFAKDQKIQRLGTSHRFSKEPAKSWEDLTRLFGKERAALEAIFAAHDMEDVVEGFFEKISTGQVTETTISQGETVEWMVAREKGAVVAKGPRCFSSKRSYEAFIVEVPIVSMTAASAPTCRISATGDCRAHTLQVDASGSSPGVKVTRNDSPITLDGQSKWSGPFENRFDQTYKFTVSGESKGSKSTKTYTFIIPKICLNLALASAPTVVEEDVPGKSCLESAVVNTCPEPECTITGPDEAGRREEFDVTVSGNGQVSLEVTDPKGSTTSLTSGASDSFTATNTFRKKGAYTFDGSVTTEFGDSATCQKVVTVGGSPTQGAWILRFFGARFGTDDEVRTDTGSGASVERTKLASGNGLGAGVGAEYLFNDRVGLEASLIAGQVEFNFQRDLANDWGMDDDDADFLSLTVGPNFHLIPDGAVDLYLGPFVGFAEIDDVEFQTLGSTQTFNFDSEFIWGAQIGLDVPFGGSQWGLHFGGRWMDLSVGDNGPQTPELNLDPLLFTAGLAYRF